MTKKTVDATVVLVAEQKDRVIVGLKRRREEHEGALESECGIQCALLTPGL